MINHGCSSSTYDIANLIQPEVKSIHLGTTQNSGNATWGIDETIGKWHDYYNVLHTKQANMQKSFNFLSLFQKKIAPIFW